MKLITDEIGESGIREVLLKMSDGEEIFVRLSGGQLFLVHAYVDDVTG